MCPHSQAPTNLYLSLGLVFTRMSRKQNHTKCSLLTLPSLSIVRLGSSCCGPISSISFLSSIPLFICSPAEGHLGCFQRLEIMNKATINIPEQLFV